MTLQSPTLWHTFRLHIYEKGSDGNDIKGKVISYYRPGRLNFSGELPWFLES
jgi:hypothetical protein